MEDRQRHCGTIAHRGVVPDAGSHRMDQRAELNSAIRLGYHTQTLAEVFAWMDQRWTTGLDMGLHPRVGHWAEIGKRVRTVLRTAPLLC
jgi:hypothetical protein